jgi:lactoylglutathione lyase
MSPKIALITIFTQDVPRMVAFYRDVLGFTIQDDLGSYVEFKSSDVRFAICAMEVMIHSVDHPSLKEPISGHPFELAFPVDTPQQVDDLYTHMISSGAGNIQGPKDMRWNQRVAFFADPDGNIHEIFADLPRSAEG